MCLFRCASSLIQVEQLFWIHLQDPYPDEIVNRPGSSAQRPHSDRWLSQSCALMENRITKKNWVGCDAKLT